MALEMTIRKRRYLASASRQAQREVSTATLRALMPGGHRLAPTESGDETERERVISGHRPTRGICLQIDAFILAARGFTVNP